MWRAYKYIFYWLYSSQKKRWGEYDFPEFTALFIMILNLFAIFYSIAIIIDILTGVMIIPMDVAKEKILVVGFSLLIIHYFIFVFNGRYKKIEKEFKGESKEERKRKGRWVLLYDIGSIVLFIFLMFFGIWVKHG